MQLLFGVGLTSRKGFRFWDVFLCSFMHKAHSEASGSEATFTQLASKPFPLYINTFCLLSLPYFLNHPNQNIFPSFPHFFHTPWAFLHFHLSLTLIPFIILSYNHFSSLCSPTYSALISCYQISAFIQLFIASPSLLQC